MTGVSREDLERHLSRLPREAWERPEPPPAPWPAEEEARPASARRRLSLRPVVAALAAAVLLAAGVGAGILIAGGDDAADGGPVQVDLAPVDSGGGASGVARLRPEAGGRASVSLSGLEPSRGGDYYELWLLGKDGELVALGSVRVPESGEAELDVDLPVDPRQFQFLDVSREPGDGDPSHSGDSVLRGPAA